MKKGNQRSQDLGDVSREKCLLFTSLKSRGGNAFQHPMSMVQEETSS